jgi:carbonic anhydrase
MQNNISPAEAIQRLKDGNQRFYTGMRSVEPLLSHLKMRELAQNGQKPFAIVLTCSDSRSPAEMIFDQGLGDLFVIRVAGNVVAPSLLASIEFAAANFGTPAVLVLGHTQCGAVKATFNNVRNPREAIPSHNLAELIGRIRPAVEVVVHEEDPRGSDEALILRKATRENVIRSMQLIMEQSQIVRDLVQEGRLQLDGAVLDISSGRVDFIEQAEVEASRCIA